MTLNVLIVNDSSVGELVNVVKLNALPLIHGAAAAFPLDAPVARA